MLNAHPLFVHYPIALLTAALLFEVLWLIFRREPLFHAATAALVLGAVGALAAAASGLQAGVAVPHEVPGAHEAMERHEVFALISAGLGLMVAAVRLWLRQRQRVVSLLALLILAALISYTGYLGGELVYTYGVGGKGGVAFQAPSVEGHRHAEGEAAEETAAPQEEVSAQEEAPKHQPEHGEPGHHH